MALYQKTAYQHTCNQIQKEKEMNRKEMDMKEAVGMEMYTEGMGRLKKKTLFCKILAAILCFTMMAASISPVTVQAASKIELALKYKGETVVVEKLAADDPQLDVTDASNCTQASYKKIKKAFGEAKKYKREAGENVYKTAYEYKEKGFQFFMEPWLDGSDMYGVTIEITSKKAELNGIKVGMSYSSVKKKLEKKYGKPRVKEQEDQKMIMLTYGPYQPIEYSFENGKVSSIYFFHS